MEAIFFNLPGLIGFWILVKGTSPVPNKEWVLLIVPPALSIVNFLLAYLVRYNLGIPFWDILSDILAPFIFLDEIFAEILRDVGIFKLSGVYSLSLALSSLASYFFRHIVRKKIFSPLSNPKSFDIYDATQNENLYFIETKNKKIYVGRIYCGPTTGNSPESFVTITPNMSGYRNDFNMVIYESFYEASSYSEDSNLDNIKIHIMYNNIASIREFSWEAFEHFLKRGTSVIMSRNIP